MHALGGEMLSYGADVLRCHAQPRTAANRRGVIESGGNGDRHAAAGDAEVERLVETLAAMLGEQVGPGHTQVRRPVLHVGRHVRGTHQDHTQPRIARLEDELARGKRILGGREAGTCQQRQCLLEDASLGESERKRGGHGLQDTRSMRAPSAARRCSIRS